MTGRSNHSVGRVSCQEDRLGDSRDEQEANSYSSIFGMAKRSFDQKGICMACCAPNTNRIE